ncbi:hypothetical protein BC830DRAFT_1163560 [Chytriomyces sp. MP71]|nr:hypothetical protein BC830DRAFT_1163560 [Chytriomyces sp. MP71]
MSHSTHDAEEASEAAYSHAGESTVNMLGGHNKDGFLQATSGPGPVLFPDEVLSPPDSKFSNGKKRGRCCCCPQRPLHRILCVSAMAVLLIVVATLLGLYFPRFPDIEVNAIDLKSLTNGSSAFRFTYLHPEKPNLNELVIQLNLTMYIGTYNPNLYGLMVDEIDLMAYAAVNTSYIFNPLLTNKLASMGSVVQVVGRPTQTAPSSDYSPSNHSQIGVAKSNGNIYFPSRTWVNYTMVFNLTYTPDPYVGLLNDPTVMELADVCGITSRYKPPGRPMQIDYNAVSSIGALKALNYAPTVSGNVKIICPFSQDEIQHFIWDLQHGYNYTQALKDVFKSGSGN